MGVKSIDQFQIPIPLADVSSQMPSPVLNLKFIPQGQTKLCWAACALMAYRQNKTRPPREECDIVNIEFPKNNCCGNTQNSNCNQTCPSADIATVFTRLTLTSSTALPIKPPDKMATDIRTEIAAGRPVEIFYNLDPIGGHVVLVAGISSADQVPEQFLVFDPAGPTSFLTIDALSRLDKKANWAKYWKGIQ